MTDPIIQRRVGPPLPLWQCHKKVRAFQITRVELDEDAASLTARLHMKDGRPLLVSQSYVDRHDPQVGGYYVQYDDGYESYSPQEAFEDGYTRIESAT